MLLKVAVYYLAVTGQGLQALPIPVIDQRTPLCCDDCRTIGNIIWSCLATIFSCTWVAIHPNIPGPDENGFVITLLRRLQLVVMALIAPELVIVWALRQLLVARRLAKQHRSAFVSSYEFKVADVLEYEWTQAHGFFALMGGFMLFDGDKPLRTLLPNELESLCQKGDIDFPRITEDEIKDRSKGDMLSKSLVIVQTGWFVLQCIARRVERLPITELELVTLAFAILNFATYGLWWNKPLNVQRPFRVPMKPSSAQKADGEVGDEGQGAGEGGNEDQSGGENGDEVCRFGVQRAIAIACKAPAAIAHTVQGAITVVRNVMRAIGGAVRESIVQTMGFVCSGRVLYRIWKGAQDTILDGVWIFVEMGSGESSSTESSNRFYAGKLTDYERWSVGAATAIIAIVFGAIHAVAWSFRFPSYTEQLLWRTFSIAIICLPAFGGVGRVALFLATADRIKRAERTLQLEVQQQRPSRLKNATIAAVVELLLLIIPVGCVVLYILARVSLLVLPFTCLRSLPPEAYQTVHWTTFIPHI